MQRNLGDPYASSPKTTRYVLYLGRRYADDPDGNQVAVYIFGEVYAVKKAMELILADDDLLWINDNKVQSETGIIIHLRFAEMYDYTLKEMWEHEYTLAEMAWEMLPPYSTQCKKFRHVWAPDQVPERVERRRGTPRASRNGMTPIADIAMACGVTARDARAAFRKAKVKKPPQGWAFPPSEVEEITKKLKEALGK